MRSMKWKTKALVQRIASRIPGGEAVYRFSQNHLLRRSFAVENRLFNAIRLLRCFDEINENIQGKRTVEIGTGWTPVLPLVFWLSGQEECDTYDLSRLMTKSHVVESARQLLSILADPNELHPISYAWRTEIVNKTRLKLL